MINIPFVKFEKIFSEEECQRIIDLAQEGALQQGKTWNGKSYAVDVERRSVKTVYIGRTAANRWVFDRMDQYFQTVAAVLGIDVAETREDLKLMFYNAGDHFNAWHMDVGPNHATARKISMSVELSPAGSYEGGLLEIMPDALAPALKVGQGGGIAFPSFRVHRVTPVVSGKRVSLVNWISGPPYR